MVAYRFCRPDDIGLLVRAVNECYDVHFSGRSPLTPADFQREVRELDVWPSNCMVAGAAGEPLAVCIATRREREVLIYRVGCRPGHQRQGHGGHVLTSLSRKLAVLGPSRLVAEVPEEWNVSRLFFESLDYREETVLTDFILERPPPPLPSAEGILPVTVDELAETKALPHLEADRCWERQTKTLINRKEQIRGLAIASPDRLEAFLLYRTQSSDTRLEALETPGEPGEEALFSRKDEAFFDRKGETLPLRRDETRRAFFSILLAHLCSRSAAPLFFPKVPSVEHPEDFLRSLGFRPGRRYVRYAATATPG